MDQVEMTDSCFHEYIILIHRLTGITIQANRKSMIQGRVRKRIRTLGLAGYSEYLDHVKSTQSENRTFIDLVTTNETYFYRTPRIWECLSKTFLAEWHAQNPKQVFRAWSAASSSGEEAYTLGVICQQFKATHPSFQFQIVGSDISQEMVGVCEKGLYRGRAVETFRQTQADLFQKFMHPVGDDFQVIPEIKSKITFHLHNLFEKPKASEKFDLILLRNVLIYFTSADQEKVLRNIRPLLKDEGLLMIGESESLAHIQTDFDYKAPLVYALKPGLVKKMGVAA